jgi:uncharacterized membrane protein YhaH (DUF805 family)
MIDRFDFEYFTIINMILKIIRYKIQTIFKHQIKNNKRLNFIFCILVLVCILFLVTLDLL